MTASAQGRDVSQYQPPLTLSALAGLDFAFCKATNGLTETDPDFAVNWRVLGEWGKPRGCYHEQVPGNPQAQAQHMWSAIMANGGVKPGDMLATVASDYAGLTDADVAAFLGELRSLAGPQHPLLAYSDLSVAQTLVETSTSYDLWAAWPSPVAPVPSQWAPARWKTWRLWQWNETGIDCDAYNGTAAELNAWVASFVTPPKPPANWTYGPPRALKALGGKTSVRLSWEPPAGAPEPPAEYAVFVYRGAVCGKDTIVRSYPRTVTGTSFEGGSLSQGQPYAAHVVASGPDGERVRPGCYASVQFETG